MNKILIPVTLVLGIIGVIGFVAFLIWYPISPLNTVFNLLFQKQVSGIVYDCHTAEPIAGAAVTIVGTGWGWNESLVWDETYLSQSKTLEDGSFNMSYNLGTELSAEKDGYLKAQKYTYPDTQLKIGMVKKTNDNSSELLSYDCKLFSQCFKTKVINGVETSWDSCANPELYKNFE